MVRALVAFVVIGLVQTVQPTVVDPGEWSRYECFRARSPITIDGVMTNAEWGRARSTAGFTDAFQPGRAVKYPTTAKMLWDDKYLYVAFDCVDDDIWGVMTKHDDPIYTEEAVEVFIDPEGRGRHYFEIDVSPLNTVVDLLVLSPTFIGQAGIAARYDVKGLRTAVRVYGTVNKRDDKDEKWTVEMAIPWSDFMGRKVNVPPNDGDSWRMNLFRVAGPKPWPDPEQLLSWSKSPGVFHEPKNFGIVAFRDQ